MGSDREPESGTPFEEFPETPEQTPNPSAATIVREPLDAAEARQQEISAAFEALDLFAHSKRYREKIRKQGQGSSLEWMIGQIDCLLLTNHETQLGMMTLAMCSNDPGVQQMAMAGLLALSMHAGRCAQERNILQTMLSREPAPPRPVSESTEVSTDVIEVRTLPDEEEWMRMFRSSDATH